MSTWWQLEDNHIGEKPPPDPESIHAAVGSRGGWPGLLESCADLAARS